MNPIQKRIAEASASAAWTVFFVGTLPIWFLIGIQLAKWLTA